MPGEAALMSDAFWDIGHGSERWVHFSQDAFP
jgi:hypothetical protein